jgi:phosphonate transport system substrate-binding protein
MQQIPAILLTSVMLALVTPVHQSASAAEQGDATTLVYSVGIVPQFEQRKLYATWKPIVDDLERRTGLHFNLVTTLKIQDFEKAFARGEFDFVYVNPYHVIQVREAQGYIPLVADSVPLRGIIVVRKDGPIKTPADLDGKTVAFPSPNALGASLLVRSDLAQVHHVRVTPLYVKTHSSVYLHVAKDIAAAGGGVEKTLQEQDPFLQAQLRVIYTTRASPSHPIVAHPRVPPQVRDKVRNALLAMGETPQGKEILLKVPVTQFIPVSFADYDIMRGWGLDKYWQTIPEQD